MADWRKQFAQEQLDRALRERSSAAEIQLAIEEARGARIASLGHARKILAEEVRKEAAAERLDEVVGSGNIAWLREALGEGRAAGLPTQDLVAAEADIAVIEEEGRQKLAEAVELSGIDALKEAISHGKFVGLLPDELRAAEDRLKSEERKAAARRGLDAAVQGRSIEELEAAIAEGLASGLLKEELQAAETALVVEEARASLEQAARVRDIKRLEAALAEGRDAGLTAAELHNAEVVLFEERRKVAARLQLDDATAGRGVQGLEASIAEGEAANLLPEDRSLSGAKAMLSALRSREAAMQRPTVEGLEAAIAACAAAGLTPEELLDAETALRKAIARKGLEEATRKCGAVESELDTGQLLEELRNIKNVLAAEKKRVAARSRLENAVRTRTIGALEESIQDGEAAGLLVEDLENAVAVLSDERRKAEAHSSLEAAMESDNVTDLEAAVRHAKTCDLTTESLLCAEILLSVELRKAAALKGLQDAMRNRGDAELEAAIEEGRMMGVAPDMLRRAEAILEEDRRKATALAGLESAIRRRELVLLEAALEEARAAGVAHADIAKAEFIINMLRARAEVHEVDLEAAVEQDKELQRIVQGALNNMSGRRLPQGWQDANLPTQKFYAFVDWFQASWNAVAATALENLTFAVQTPSGDALKAFAAMHKIWELSGTPKDSALRGFVLLASKIYSMEGCDVDSCVGFIDGVDHNVPAPYKTMNVAARLLGGEQKKNNVPPRNAAEAQAPFQVWVKFLACLAAAARDMARPEITQSLDCLGAYGAQARASLQEGLHAWPDVLAIGVDGEGQPLAGSAPCFFYGLNLSWDTSGEVMSVYEKLRGGDDFFFCGPRSTTLHPDVAFSFLGDDSTGKKNVFCVVEGVTHALPVWHCSQYPDEVEALVPGLTHCEVVCDPIPAASLKGSPQKFLFIRLRYKRSGFDMEFLEHVRSEVSFDTAMLWTRSLELRRNRAVHDNDPEALRRAIQEAEETGLDITGLDAARKALAALEERKRDKAAQTRKRLDRNLDAICDNNNSNSMRAQIAEQAVNMLKGIVRGGEPVPVAVKARVLLSMKLRDAKNRTEGANASSAEVFGAALLRVFDAEVKLMFLLDQSGSVGHRVFYNMLKPAAKALAAEINRKTAKISGKIAWGAIAYGTCVELVGGHMFQDVDVFTEAISGYNYRGGSTPTTEALLLANAIMEGSDGRQNALRIVLNFTDGAPDDLTSTVQAVQRLKRQDLIIISLGIGDGISEGNLTKISSDGLAFKVASFNVLKEFVASAFAEVEVAIEQATHITPAELLERFEKFAAELMKGDGGKMHSDAEVQARQLEFQQADARDKVREAMRSRNVRDLEAAIAEGKAAVLPVDELREAQEALVEAQEALVAKRKASARLRLQKATRNGVVADLEVAVEEGRCAQLGEAELVDARTALADLKRKAAAREALVKATKGNDVAQLEWAIDEGGRAGLRESELVEARLALSDAQQKSSAREMLRSLPRGTTAIKLEAALEEARRAGLDEEELDKARTAMRPSLRSSSNRIFSDNEGRNQSGLVLHGDGRFDGKLTRTAPEVEGAGTVNGHVETDGLRKSANGNETVPACPALLTTRQPSLPNAVESPREAEDARRFPSAEKQQAELPETPAKHQSRKPEQDEKPAKCCVVL